MIGALKAFAEAIGLASMWSKYFMKKDDQNTGAKLAGGEINKATLDEVQAVNDARNDPANLQRVHDASSRD